LIAGFRLNKHDSTALTLFLREIRNGALKFAQIRVSSEEAALDILQDSMIGFVQAVDKYEKEAWKNLFYKILKRRITDWLRKRTWRNKLAPMLSFSQITPEQEERPPEPEFLGANDTDLNLDAERLLTQFETALSNLPARQQETYLLRQWQGMSVNETADIMKCSTGTVKTHLSRAMQSLKEQLGEWINDET